ncbi:MAG: aliphatic sulfonate ABC transporter substrate-binding protein [Bacillota bacterium]|nr:aliphatic sulfonate ABC transporter substrate-binding protein [Bacillota bacterium]
MKKKELVLGLAAVLIAAMFAGCGTGANKDDASTVRIAYFPNITHSQALIGKEQGDFQKAFGDKTKIEWKQFNAGSSEMEALLAGAVDIGYIGPGPAINAYAKSRGDIQIIAGATDAGAILVSRKDIPIKSVKDLDGKKVAVPQFGNTQDLSLRYLLQQNKLKDKTKGGTVEIVQADNSDIKTLLDKKSIDAALVPEPWGSKLVNESGAKVVLDYNQIWKEGKYPTAVIAVRRDFLRNHSDLVEKFLRTHVELTEYANKNVDKASETVNKQIEDLTKKPLSKDVLDSSFKRLTITYDPQVQATKDMVDLSVSAGFLKQKPNLNSLFDLSILNKILKEKGQQPIK